MLQAALVVSLFAHLNQDVKVAVFLSQCCYPLILAQIHCNTGSHTKSLVKTRWEKQPRESVGLKTLTEGGQ